ncbi:glucan phosphoethanolaminetransferase (alkaline phosphatase superfamily) [Paenibacillus shirakamiensis]|uniref:Glucan phosphoethanolaminetransferase (Alkaline phosphatase superfamily) n=1 Tax=Paenibacillus shirakamiensis TaxID=1265935 RepID=A0ABS4JEE4_9BACL|nr:glucan phosphoethanolaminetransferase (alkaline phosphatase superfamily) [Paenibacillus shirakamiensis]
MKRSDFFYIWVAIISYITGPMVYVFTLRTIYGETSNNMGPLITWTVPTFFTVDILLYLLCVILLRSINRYYFWLQTLAFVFLSIIPVYIVLLMAGFFINRADSFLLSEEGLLFLSFFSSIAIVASYGTWIAQKHLSKRPFYIVSVMILGLCMSLYI